MKRRLILAVLSVGLVPSPCGAVDPAGSPWLEIENAKCAGLVLTDFSDAVGARTEIRSAELVAAGADPASSDLPAHCRATALIAPKNNVELRLPIANWSGRVLMAGCGGLCGAIEMQRTDDALIRGYAVAHTDMGHASADMAFTADAGQLEDFVHRSTHVATVLLKAVVASYYGRAPDYAYFRGCSTGGRQGLTAALMYPDDYDGIVAAAPAAGYGAVPNIAWAVKSNLRADGFVILDVPAIRRLHAGVLAACDKDDGIADGIVANPDVCDFDPAYLACSAASDGDCLSAEQIDAARQIYDGLPSTEIEYSSRGFMRGGELGWIGRLATDDGAPGDLIGVARNYLRRFGDLPAPPQSIAELDMQHHAPRLTEIDDLPSFGADGRALAAFNESGGKFLFMHAWADNSLTPATAIDVYDQQRAAFGEDLDSFMRLFVVPGVYHCGGGPGPDAIDTLTAIESWVEGGNEPDRLIAYHTVERRPYPAEPRFPLNKDEYEFARPVFLYPGFATYSGVGDPNAPENWIKSDDSK